MPTVLRIGRARVVIYPNDHLPPHVHVVDGDKHAKVTLPREQPDEHPRVVEVHGFSRVELARILEAVDVASPELRKDWRRIHG